jgi:hypothetical protein
MCEPFIGFPAVSSESAPQNPLSGLSFEKSSVLMALVTIHAVVHIPADVRVMEIVGVPAPMATRALENRVVGWTRVAGGTNAVSIAVFNVEPGVVERRPSPCSRIVTSRASSCENCRRGLMDRICSSGIVRGMAAVTIRGEGGVVVVYVATGAGHFRVKARQREGCSAVIELAVSPHNRVVT